MEYFDETSCPDCAVGIDTPHERGCDVARCLECGGQWISCDCHYDPDAHDTEVDIWTGFWPDELTCIAFGFYCYFGPDYGEDGWIECDSTDPRATPDLNRLMRETVWDPKSQTRVPK